MKLANLAIEAAAVLVSANFAAAQTLGVGTTSQGSLGYSLGAAVAKVAANHTDLKVVVQPYGGSSVFVPLLNSGELEFGINNTMETILGKTGKDTFEGKPNPNIRVVAALVPSYVSLLVRKDSGINTVDDLKGKRIPWGFPAQTIVQYMMTGILANAGLKESEFSKVPTPNVVRQLDDMVAGRVDATFTALGTARVIEVDVQVGGVRYLSLSEAPDRARVMESLVPGTYVGKVEPGPGRTGVIQPTNFMAYMFLLIAGSAAKEDAVYKVTKALHANKDELAASHPAYRSFEAAKMALQTPEVEFHPGATRFYREAGIWPAR